MVCDLVRRITFNNAADPKSSLQVVTFLSTSSRAMSCHALAMLFFWLLVSLPSTARVSVQRRSAWLDESGSAAMPS